MVDEFRVKQTTENTEVAQRNPRIRIFCGKQAAMIIRRALDELEI